jgi:hypothetical protein
MGRLAAMKIRAYFGGGLETAGFLGIKNGGGLETAVEIQSVFGQRSGDRNGNTECIFAAESSPQGNCTVGRAVSNEQGQGYRLYPLIIGFAPILLASSRGLLVLAA